MGTMLCGRYGIVYAHLIDKGRDIDNVV